MDLTFFFPAISLGVKYVSGPQFFSSTQCSSSHIFSGNQSRRSSKVKWAFKSQDTESISNLVLLTMQMWAADATSWKPTYQFPHQSMESSPDNVCPTRLLQQLKFRKYSFLSFFLALPFSEKLKPMYTLKLGPPKSLFNYSCIWFF